MVQHLQYFVAVSLCRHNVLQFFPSIFVDAQQIPLALIQWLAHLVLIGADVKIELVGQIERQLDVNFPNVLCTLSSIVAVMWKMCSNKLRVDLL